MKLSDVVRGVEIKEYPKGIKSGVDEELEGYNSLASAEVVVDREKIAFMIKDKYWDTLEYNRDLLELHAKDLAKSIATAIESGSIIRLKEKE